MTWAQNLLVLNNTKGFEGIDREYRKGGCEKLI